MSENALSEFKHSKIKMVLKTCDPDTKEPVYLGLFLELEDGSKIHLFLDYCDLVKFGIISV